MSTVMEVAWRKSLHMRPTGHSLAVSGGDLIVAGQQRRLFRIDPVSGHVLWTATVRDAYGTVGVGSGVAVYLDLFVRAISTAAP